MLVGGGHVAAWVTGVMARVPASAIIMKTNAALGLLLSGLALILLVVPSAGAGRRRVAQACAAFALLIGLATFSEHIAGWDLGIDQVLAAEQLGAAGTVSPNRMGPPASLSLTLLGTALLFLARPRGAGRRRAVHEPLALIVALLGLLSIVGYLYRVSALYTIARYTAIAWPTAFSFVALAVGVLCAEPEDGLMARVTADDAGGAIVRALLGPMVFLPIVFGWVWLAGERGGWFDTAMGTGVMMLLFILTFSSLLFFASRRVSSASAAIRTSEEALRKGEQFLSFALTTARTGAWDLDLVDHTARRSLEHDRIFGYQELLPEWTYEKFLEHVVPDEREAVDRKFRVAMDARSDWSFECRIVRPNGEIRWIWAAGRHRFDDDGQPRRMAGVVQDITERKLAENALQKSEQQFRALIENLNVGVALIDETGKFSLYNGQFLAMFGLSPDADVRNVNDQDWSAWQVFDEHGDLLDVDEHPVRKAALTGLAVRDTLVDVRLPGGRKAAWMLVSAEPLLDPGGRAERVICTYSDITERKHAEMALRQANERLQEADQRKDEFLAVLSHELRNPLAPVRAAVYVLEHAVPGGEQANRARIVIDRQVAQLARLVDDLLDVTRISRGKIHLQREMLDLTGLVRRTAEDHRELFRAKDVHLEVDVPGEQLWVDGDAQRLAQVVGNLLHNAAKFTEVGGRTAIRVRREAGSGEAVISVADNGVGINPAALPRLFDPFMQVDKTLDRARGGLGLGLALVKSLVEMHGGSVLALSDGIGHGAEFRIRLPPQPAPLAGASLSRSGGHPSRRIFIIEDNVDAADSLREALELAGHEVEVAYNGVDGIERARHFKPDIVLCDIGLPGMNGYEVARAMRNDETIGAAHLVALTGYALPEDLARAREAGFDVHIAKPPSPEALQETLARLGSNRAATPPHEPGASG
jgi:PAS domain S-box-containing protein